MIILGLTDLHGDGAGLDAVAARHEDAALVVLTGDITHFGGRNEVAAILAPLRAAVPRVLAVAGNCDKPEVEDWLSENGVAAPLRGIVVDGVGFVGLNKSLPCPGHTPNEMTEETFEQALAEAGADLPDETPFVLLTHQPPFGTKNDLPRTGRHVGSRAIRAFIERRQPLLCFSGHIHEGIGVDRIGDTSIVNPGPFRGGCYARVVLGATIESIDIERA